MKMKDFLLTMVERQGSDLFLRVDSAPRLRLEGRLTAIEHPALSVDDMWHLTKELLTTEKQMESLKTEMDTDFAISLEGVGRFRINIFLQRGTPAMVVRYVKDVVGTFEQLSLPVEVMKKFARETQGLILVTGPAGSGKSTTISSMLQYVNENLEKHIITVEDPIEFIFKDKNSLINQRELGIDVQNYPSALKHFTLQSPDIIYIGVIRDPETMQAAMSAAETGVLVVSTMHTIDSVQTIERVTNLFPPHLHNEVKMQMSLLLKGIISLRLIPRQDGAGRVPAYETMALTPTVARLIREGKLTEIKHFIEEGAMFGMQSFKQSLVKLVKDGKISEDEARNYADSKDEFNLELRGIKRIA
ncbi:MAG: PilT/PilU family type 4a pilus ATPase [Candidatus Omnitrophota bacterium]|nr:PilT/PilU family type 4a pilus ATPase [Candidatus Omnitrophota bacterium]